MKDKIKNIAEKLEHQIRMHELDLNDRIKDIPQIILLLEQGFSELKEIVSFYKFKSEMDEIFFFKIIKPKFFSKLIYYRKVYNIEMMRPNGQDCVLKNYFINELNQLENFYNKNIDFYKYYRSGSTHLDKYFFLRGKQDIQMTMETFYFERDPNFSTICDFKVAKIVANEMLRIYLNISEEFKILNDCKIQFKDNQIFAIVTVCGNESFAKEQAYKRCSLATDIFKICSDLYHNNFYNPKKWQFDIDVDFVTSGNSFCFYKDLDSNNPENFYANFHANRYATYVDTKLLESRTKWNIEDFESLYHIIFSPDANKFHEVIKRACHIYSQSFSINNLYERVVLLCTVLDTLATNEREGKVPQLKKYLPILVLKCERLTEQLNNYIESFYDIRSAYIHNAEKKKITEKDVDKLEKIVYRVILQMIRNSTRYKCTKQLCVAIDEGSFEPILDNLPDIYI